MNREKLPGMLILLLAICFANIPALAQQTPLSGFTFRLYQKPDTNSTQLKPKDDNCTWTQVATLGKHPHTYKIIITEFHDTLVYTTTAYYAKVESSCGDVGYAHSSQLETETSGNISFPQTYTSNQLKLLELPPMNGCSDFDYIGGTFKEPSGKTIEIPLNTYWGFYATDENCESIKNTYIYNCTLELKYKVFRYYDWVDNVGWTYHPEITSTLIYGECLRTVTGTHVNIRKGPGKKYEVLGQLNPGDLFQIKEINHEVDNIDDYYGSWVKIVYNEIEGWIFNKFIQRNE